MRPGTDLDIAYMIDQSHNLKPKIEAMIQTVLAAQEHFAKALLVDHAALARSRAEEDLVLSERIPQERIRHGCTAVSRRLAQKPQVAP